MELWIQQWIKRILNYHFMMYHLVVNCIFWQGLIKSSMAPVNQFINQYKRRGDIMTDRAHVHVMMHYGGRTEAQWGLKKADCWKMNPSL